MHLHTVRSFAFSATVSSPILIGSAVVCIVGCPVALGAPMTTHQGRRPYASCTIALTAADNSSPASCVRSRSSPRH